MSIFSRFPQETSLIGQILLRYSLLELDLCNCVSCARGEFDEIFKSFFRTRGETQRLRTADTLGRLHFQRHDLETEFAMCTAAMKQCLRVRNCYAHCIWWGIGAGQLAFAQLEDAAEQKMEVHNLERLRTAHNIATSDTLSEQIAYFQYTEDFIRWLGSEVLVRSGKRDIQHLPKPRQRHFLFQCSPDKNERNCNSH